MSNTVTLAVEIREQLRKAGHGKWIAMAIASWRVVRTYRGLHVNLTVNGRRLSTRTPFVFVGNNEYVIEGRTVGKRKQLTNGQIFVYLAPQIATRQATDARAPHSRWPPFSSRRLRDHPHVRPDHRDHQFPTRHCLARRRDDDVGTRV